MLWKTAGISNSGWCKDMFALKTGDNLWLTELDSYCLILVILSFYSYKLQMQDLKVHEC